MKYEPINPPQIPLVDNFCAPEIFATGIAGCGMVHQNILITLEGLRCDHTHRPPTVERVVCARVALTIPAAQALVLGLNGYLVQQGVGPTEMVSSDATRQ